MENKYGYIFELIEKQVQSKPDKIAVIDENNRINYRQLDEQSSQLANYLMSIGVNENSLVGIYMESSVHVVISILAILKAGGAYVPLDPNYPAEHILYMIHDADLKFIISKSQYIDSLNSDINNESCKCIDIKSALQNNYFIEKERGKIENSQDKLACVIYTSGTTGKPKGVMTSHANLFSYVKALTHRLQIKKNDIYLHTASIAFSSSNRQIFIPLCSGCTIVMASKEDKLNPQLFFQLIKFQNVTIIDLVPTYVKNCIKFLENMQHDARTELLENKLRMVLSASEALISTISDRFRKLLDKDVRYVNMYGMTETTGIVATYEIPVESGDNYHIVPIGKSIGNMRLSILNEKYKPVQNNENGFLYISGPQLTMGYLNKPEVNDKAFIQNTTRYNQEIKIMFKTGDICRYNYEGNIEYIGRSDHQIKINGVRIEPKEIELIALQFQGVLEAVVMSREIFDVKNLILFYIKKEKMSVNQKELKKYFKKKLPKYMIPSYYISLKEFPLTPNGKINRIALEKYELILEDEKEIIKPRNETDQILLDICKTVLHIDKIGIKHSLFDFSSNSITMFHIISQIYDSYNINIPLSYVYKYPTVMEWSDYIEKQKSNGKVHDTIKYHRGVL
ncbi:non-ribosomal peptide synthetase [Vallitalea sp.]|jgi:aspartate racemase|uniref:non-ribosomal peptide synthetase n=1 Tax=Vallitalea sp. TaxID=1882829 RepID=UPI0025EE61D5|nr:non-ribosomal peptide synthetase [Vallitalea sp.]MCT4686725.1 non-ribosomal peptide synthetase [Vallitalea sp.]